MHPRLLDELLGRLQIILPLGVPVQRPQDGCAAGTGRVVPELTPKRVSRTMVSRSIDLAMAERRSGFVRTRLGLSQRIR